MSAHVRVSILLYFSYMLGFLFYYILLKFDSPDGSTCWGLKYYNILVNFDHPDGSTSWGYMLFDFN